MKCPMHLPGRDISSVQLQLSRSGRESTSTITEWYNLGSGRALTKYTVQNSMHLINGVITAGVFSSLQTVEFDHS